MVSKIVIPGERLCKIGPQHISGVGTYVKEIEVHRTLNTKHSIPFAGAIVTCRTVGRYAKCMILCVEDSILPHPFNGLIRKEHMKMFDKDSTDVFQCYRTGDIVLARVISLGDLQSCLLSTAEEALGVVYGRCPDNHKMSPLNFTELACPMCNLREVRKVAKISHKAESKAHQRT